MKDSPTGALEKPTGKWFKTSDYRHTGPSLKGKRKLIHIIHLYNCMAEELIQLRATTKFNGLSTL